MKRSRCRGLVLSEGQDVLGDRTGASFFLTGGVVERSGRIAEWAARSGQPVSGWHDSTKSGDQAAFTCHASWEAAFDVSGHGCSVVPRMFATLDGFATPILDLALVQPLIE
jgi:hypothetical protein